MQRHLNIIFRDATEWMYGRKPIRSLSVFSFSFNLICMSDPSRIFPGVRIPVVCIQYALDPRL